MQSAIFTRTMSSTTVFSRSSKSARATSGSSNASASASGSGEQAIRGRVGIRERRTVLPLDYIRTTRNADVRAGQEAALYSNVETARRAAPMALERAGLRAKDVGMVIAGGCCPDMSIPSEACRIAAALDIEAIALDVNS